MSNVGDVLDTKGSELMTVDPRSTVFEAVVRMVRASIGALVVVDGEQLVGIIMERDYLRKVAVEGRTSCTTLVQEIMSCPVVCAHRGDTVDHCMSLMTQRRIRHVPIIDGTRLIGIISIGDLVRRKLDEQHHEIGRLVDYIQTSGTYAS